MCEMLKWSKQIFRTIDKGFNSIGLKLTHPRIWKEIDVFECQKYSHILKQLNGQRQTKCLFVDLGALPEALTYAGIFSGRLTIVTAAHRPYWLFQDEEFFDFLENTKLKEKLQAFETSIPSVCFDVVGRSLLTKKDKKAVGAMLRKNHMIVDFDEHFTKISYNKK